MKKFFITIKETVSKLFRFLTYDIWRVSNGDGSSKRTFFYNIIKSFILAFRNINGSQISTRASALTYSTLLAIVPMLAVLFAIARGFGFENIVKSELFSAFQGQQRVLEEAMEYIDSSIQYAQGGIFLGIGIVLLLYTVINLLSNIENSFNDTWGVKKNRSYHRMFTDYLALIIITPVFIVCNAGLSIFLTSIDYVLVEFVVSPLLKVTPYALTILLFTFIYAYIPNTKVKLIPALIGGIFAGMGFQLFQWLYISGQIWISKYNAIYGGFAALPLLLLWLQLTWFITLLGVELSFAYQNINKFSFENETKNISRRYKDFVIIMIMSLIVKRFEEGGKPYTADDLSESYKIPIRLTNEILFFLSEVGLIIDVPSEDGWITAYSPAIDINKITVSYLLDKVDRYGSEDFLIDIEKGFKNDWEVMLEVSNYSKTQAGQILLKDL